MKRIAFLLFLLPGSAGIQAQNVGIGTTTPAYKLHIGAAANGLRIEGPATAATGAASLSIGGTGKIEIDKPGMPGGRLTILENGNIGIGEPNPGFPLNFESNLGEKISFYGTSGSNYGIGVQGGVLQIHANVATDDIAFGTGSSASFTENMRIKGNGNVGIGTAAPQGYGHGGNNKILEIKNPNVSVNSQAQLMLSTGAADGSMGGITWAQHNIVSNQMAAFLGCVLDPFNTGTKMVFYTRNAPANLLTEKMTIDGNGNVGIGVANPANILHVNTGTVRFEGRSAAGGTALSIGGYGDILVDKTGVAGGRLIIKENGSVGIGTTNPTSDLTVNGTMAGKVASVTGSGPSIVPIGTALYTSLNTSGSSGSYTLPAASSCPGRMLILRNDGAYPAILYSQGGQFYNSYGNAPVNILIMNHAEGSTTKMVQFISDGASWIYWWL